MFRIGEFSQYTKTTVKTLRYYDEIGLLKPEYVDNDNGYRYYATGQLYDIQKILALRNLGLSVADVKNVISGRDATDILSAKKNELETEIELNKNRLAELEFLLSGKEKYNIRYQAVLKNSPECIIYTKTMLIHKYEDYFKLIPPLGEQLLKVNPDIKCTVPEYCFNVYLDGEYRNHDFTVKFCEAVDRMGKETDGITFEKIPSVPIVSVFHKGAYEKLSDAYAFAFEWLEKNNREMSDFPRECYIDGIWNNKDSSEWLTEIQIPIKP